MKLGTTPNRFLAETDSAEIAEIFAFYTLQSEDREAERSDSALTDMFGEAE